MLEEFPQIIAVEGPIGVGKTTLARALAEQLNARLILEKFDENPFLPLFYRNPERYALQTELSFLINRFSQQEKFKQVDLFAPYTVSDYLFDKSALFASLTLSDHELQLFKEVYSILRRHLPQPDLVIYLHAPVEVLLNRISLRGRSYERNIKREYLEQLCEIYHKEFSLPHDFPVVAIDTTEIDFRKTENVKSLLEIIKSEAKNNKLYPILHLKKLTMPIF